MQVVSTFSPDCKAHSPSMTFHGRKLFHTHGKTHIHYCNINELGSCECCINSINGVKYVSSFSLNNEKEGCMAVSFDRKPGVVIFVDRVSSDTRIRMFDDMQERIDGISAISRQRLIIETQPHLYVFKLSEIRDAESRVRDFESKTVLKIGSSDSYVHLTLRDYLVVNRRGPDRIEVFDLNTCVKIFVSKSVILRKNSLAALNPDTVVSVSTGDAEIVVWNVTDKQIQASQSIYASFQVEPVVCALRDKQHFVTGPHYSRLMKIWKLGSNQHVAIIENTCKDRFDPILACACPSGNEIAFYCDNNGMVVKTLARVEFCLFQLNLPGNRAVEVFSDGRKAVYGEKERQERLDPEEIWQSFSRVDNVVRDIDLAIKRSIIRPVSRRGRDAEEMMTISKCDELQLCLVHRKKIFGIQLLPREIVELIICVCMTLKSS